MPDRPSDPSASRIDYDAIAEVYDLYAASDADLPFFLSEVRKVRGRVLELMAGTGRVSLPLLRAGAALTCVDGSPAMLRVLSRKLAAHGLSAEVVSSDVAELHLPAVFELAILPFNSFMELVTDEAQTRTLAAVRSCLVPGGRFVCTLHNPSVRGRGVDGTLRLVGRFPAPDGSLVVSGFETGGPVVTRLQLFERYGPDGLLVEKRLLEMRFRLVEKGDFERMAREAGFRVTALHGDYGRGPFDPDRSPSMIWVLEKAG